MTDLKTIEAEDRRRTILDLLADDQDHMTSVAMLYRAIPHTNTLHKNVAITTVRDDVRWLEKRMLVTLKIEDAEIYVTLTQRGKEVSEGRQTVQGVAKPLLD